MKRCRKIRIFQEDSYVSLDYMNASLQVYRKKGPELKSLKDVEILAPKLDKTEPLRQQLDHFLDCIRHNRKPWPSGEHGLEALKLALQITEELEKFELTHHQRPATFLPNWAHQIGSTIARTVSDAIQSGGDS